MGIVTFLEQEAGGQAYYQVVLEETRVVRQIFDWVGRDGVSIGEVRRRLHVQGTKTQKGKEWWDRTTIWGMLKNTAYRGFCGIWKDTCRRAVVHKSAPKKGQSAHPRRGVQHVSTRRWTNRSSSMCPDWSAKRCLRQLQSSWPRTRNVIVKASVCWKYLLQGPPAV